MNSDNHQVLKLIISLVLLGLLSGCILANVAADAAYAVSRATQKNRATQNSYEPIIMTSNENKIRIKYRSVGSKAEHEQVKQMMSDHCDGSYIETDRVQHIGYTHVEAECLHETNS